jgi:CBS domain-containing protein
MAASQLLTAKSSRSARGGRPGLAPPIARVRIPLAYNVTVGDVMSRVPAAIGPSASLFDALVLLRSQDISGVPVVDTDQNVVGVLSQKDITRSLGVAFDLPDTKGLLDVLLAGIRTEPETFLTNFRSTLETTSVESAMSRPPIVAQVDAPLELVMEVMSENSINRLPVVEKNRLVGIVTPTDLVSAALRTRPGKRVQHG